MTREALIEQTLELFKKEVWGNFASKGVMPKDAKDRERLNVARALESSKGWREKSEEEIQKIFEDVKRLGTIAGDPTQLVSTETSSGPSAPKSPAETEKPTTSPDTEAKPSSTKSAPTINDQYLNSLPSTNYGGTRSDKLTTVVVHETQEPTLEGTLAALRRNKTSVHYVIDTDGTIYSLVPPEVRAHHAKEGNDATIGIKIVANHHTGQNATQDQKDSLAKLLPHLKEKYGVSSLMAHKDVLKGHTTCDINEAGIDLDKLQASVGLKLVHELPTENSKDDKKAKVQTNEIEAASIIDSAMSFEEATSGAECPEGLLENLELLNIKYYGFDGKVHQGQLVVFKPLAAEIKDIFDEIYRAKFPIEKMIPISKYGWDDNASMSANNTSAFNFRNVGTPDGGEITTLSNHVLSAIDINPRTNPYVGADGRNKEKYDPKAKGALTPDCSVVKIFEKHGWTWGGNWKTDIDYQHFQKKLPDSTWRKYVGRTRS